MPVRTKVQIVERIWREIVSVHEGDKPRWQTTPGLPPMIPSKNGKSIIVSDQILMDIYAYARLMQENDPALGVELGTKDINGIVQRAFGFALDGIDLETPSDDAIRTLSDRVKALLISELNVPREDRTYVYGCWLIREDFAGDIAFGPVRFERRDLWLARMRDAKRVSSVIYRRMIKRWSGQRLRRLKGDANSRWEESLIDVIGDCPTVCSVTSFGLGNDAAKAKSVLAARLAMMAVALLWDRPARALEGFGLLIDGGLQHQNILIIGSSGRWGTTHKASKMVGTTWIEFKEWQRIWADNGWLTQPVGDLLAAMLRPADRAIRPDINRPLLHALWWMYEGCKAEAPLMAAAKFGACLDILAGGTSEGNILQLIKARLGVSADDPITPDLRTVREVVKTIYGAARSKTIHGSNDRYDRDWTGVRDLAEHLTRRCFVEVLTWLSDNPDSTNLSGALGRNKLN